MSDGLTAEQEAERLAHETFPNPPENVRTHILGDLIGKRAALRVGFVAGAEWATEREKARADAAEARVAEWLEVARELQTTDDTGLWCFMCNEMVMVCTCAGGRLRALAAPTIEAVTE